MPKDAPYLPALKRQLGEPESPDRRGALAIILAIRNRNAEVTDKTALVLASLPVKAGLRRKAEWFFSVGCSRNGVKLKPIFFSELSINWKSKKKKFILGHTKRLGILNFVFIEGKGNEGLDDGGVPYAQQPCDYGTHLGWETGLPPGECPNHQDTGSLSVWPFD